MIIFVRFLATAGHYELPFRVLTQSPKNWTENEELEIILEARIHKKTEVKFKPINFDFLYD